MAVLARRVDLQIANYIRLTDALETFDVKEQHLSELAAGNPRMRVVQGALLRVDPDGKTCTLDDGTVVPYDRLCLCTGGAPRLIAEHPLVLGVRDTQVRPRQCKRACGYPLL